MKVPAAKPIDQIAQTAPQVINMNKVSDTSTVADLLVQ